MRNPKDPVPYFHAADCFLHLDDKEMAKAALHLCMKMCGDNPDFSAMRERASMIYSALEGKEVVAEPLKKKSPPKKSGAKSSKKAASSKKK